jgi:hypothetical protein
MKITSLKNEKVKFWASLNMPSSRMENKKFIVDGESFSYRGLKIGISRYSYL